MSTEPDQIRKRKHTLEIKKWADHKDAVVWVFDHEWVVLKGYPHWLEGNDYKTILPEYTEAWQAFLDGELQVSDPDHHGVVWVDWCWQPPAFDLPPECYRRKPKPREYWLNLDTNTWNYCKPREETRYRWLLVKEVTNE